VTDKKGFKIDDFRVTPEAEKVFAEARARLKANGKKATLKPGGRQPFVQYPVAAILRLVEAESIWTVKLYGFLLHLGWKNDGRPIKLTNSTLKILKMDRWQKYRALLELERLGLISVERRQRRSPLVAIVPC
jgi:hypothetical protein